MNQSDRRKYRRTRLRLRVTRLEGLGSGCEGGDIWTADVSAGGMYFHVPLETAPPVGTYLTFELNVPPGEGYSPSEGRVRGSGRVVRTAPAPDFGTGVAVEFTRPLALEF